MMSFDVQVSGYQVGRALRDDPEELSYALVALADLSETELDELSGYLDGVDKRAVLKWAEAVVKVLTP